jgi:High potential iron-sulfur protein
MRDTQYQGSRIGLNQIKIRGASRRQHGFHYVYSQEITLSKIARRKFIQLSAVAAAGCFVRPGAEARADGLPHLTEDDPVAKSMKYTHDSSTVDPASRANPAPNQHCASCALVQGEDGQEWRPCQIFPGKAVNANGWCSVWAPKA